MVLKEVQCFFYPIKTRVAFDSSTGFVLIIPVFPDLDKLIHQHVQKIKRWQRPNTVFTGTKTASQFKAAV